MEIMIAYMIQALRGYAPSIGEYHVNSTHCALEIANNTQLGHTNHMNTSPHF